MDEITIIDVKPQLVIGMRKRGKYEQISEMIPKICQYTETKGLKISGPPVFICHETSPESNEGK